MNTPDREPPIILFDDTCSLCVRAVAFVRRHDRRGCCCRFLPRRSRAGQRLLRRHARTLADEDSVALIDGSRVLFRSDAVVAIAARLDGPWRLLALLRFIPRPLRDAVYRCVARRRRCSAVAGACRITPDDTASRPRT